jgi:hypothetical protein
VSGVFSSRPERPPLTWTSFRRSIVSASWLALPGTGQNYCSMELGALEPRELCYLLVYQTESTSANATQRE